MKPSDHERLVVYRKSLEAAAALESIAAMVPEARRDLRDQLRRASASIPLNIAEGASEFSPAEKSRFYRMARRSATECMAILDLLRLLPGEREPRERPNALLREIVCMLVALSKAAERRSR